MLTEGKSLAASQKVPPNLAAHTPMMAHHVRNRPTRGASARFARFGV